jgi:hypothetical protein
MFSTLPTRRHFLGSAAGLGAALVCRPAAANLIAAPASPKKVAALVTTYARYTHADNIVTRFMEGFSIVGKSYPPPCTMASLFIEQVNDLDIGRPLARRWKIPLADSIADALTLGTGKLAVDGVVIVAEHGDYPTNAKGQILYPRRRFFEEVIKVFKASGRAVPVFNDKHLSYSWPDAKWMIEQSRELKFPMLAGSSVPVTYRRPNLQPKPGTEWQAALGVGYGHFEIYGFHTLEALQVMTETRPGGETGVKAVQALEGKQAWGAAADGRWDRSLLEEAVAWVPGKRTGKLEEEDANALVYLIEYRDGLKAAAYLSPKHVQEFAFAGRVKGEADPRSCWYELPKPQRDHFSFLVQHAGNLIVKGKADYPVERTLLTTGMLDFLIESKANGGKRIETPELDVKYQVQ